ncbi:HNH endonuclease [Leifsonia sp. Root112D2]|uniref:HNH endonuclease n=1 Tax=Leifsonia sp. Root112D2 TaxID=1736426 RepID=UPI000AC53DC8|nr:HNH endonuclease [Leifsonia sp. Root112D2]
MTSVNGPYEDLVGGDGLVRYSYQSREGGDSLKLRRALELQVPLIHFQGNLPGIFVPIYPVYVVADDIAHRSFAIALDESMRFFGDPLHMVGDQRRYAERTALQRLHQPVFRARVMHAYERSCAVCRLKHPDLLDAAHSQPATAASGGAHVTYGLAMCKLHHAAYDRNLLSITADYEVRINRGLLDEVDGPMLRHGLQDTHGTALSLPARQAE